MTTVVRATSRAGGRLVQDWDDDAEYRAAVGRTWLTVVIALCCAGVLACVIFAGVLGFFGLSDVLSIVSD